MAVSGEHAQPSSLQLRKLLQVYSNALRADPGDLVMRTKLAEVLRLLGRHDEAIAIYSSVAWAYGVSGNLGQAIMLCKLILELNPQHRATQEMLAKLFASKEIRDRKQSVPVVRVGGQWVADPRTHSSSISIDAPGGEGSLVVSPEAIEQTPFDGISKGASLPFVRPLDGLRAPSASPPVTPDRRASRTGPRLPPAAYEPLSHVFDAPQDDEPEGVEHVTVYEKPARQRKPSGPAEAGPPELKLGDGRPESEREPVLPAQVATRLLPEPIDPSRVRPLPKPSPAEAVLPVHSVPVPLPQGLPSPTGFEPTKIDTERPPPRAVSADASGRPVLDPFAARPTLREAPERAAPPPVKPPRSDAPPPAAAPVEPAAPAVGPEAPEAGAPSIIEAVAAEPPAPSIIEAVAAAELGDKRLSGEELPAPEPPAVPPDAEDETIAPRRAAAAVTAALDANPPAAPPDAPPDEARPRRITQPGYVVSPTDPGGPVQPLKTTRRYATVQRKLTDAERGALAERTDPDEPPTPRPPEPAEPAEPQPPCPPEPASAGGLSPAVSLVAELPEDSERAAAESNAPPAGSRPTLRMQSSQMSSLLRIDAEKAFSERPAAINFMTLQREVQAAGRSLNDLQLATTDEEEAERNLQDTIRESRGIVGMEGPPDSPHVPFPIFSDLDTPAFLAMVEKLERHVYPPGHIVFNEGDPGDSLYLVSAGSLQVLKSDESGGSIQLARLAGGSFFGEFGLLTDGIRHATVRCVDECELLVLRRETLMDLSQDHPSISWTLRVFYQQRVMANVMATSPLFRAVSPEDRKAVLSRFVLRRYLPGEVIIEEGKPGTGFFVVLVGEVAVACHTDEDPDFHLGMLSEGDYVGEMSLLSGCVAEATVHATRITEVLMLDPRDFYELAAAHPEIWAEVQQEADRRRESTAQRLAVRSGGEVCLL